MRPWPDPLRKSTAGMTAGVASDGVKCFPGLSALGRGILVIFALLSTLGAGDLALAKASFIQLTSSTGGDSGSASISADGTRIAFVSTGDLKPGVPGNTDGSNELFLWTQRTGITQLTNTAAATILQPSISARRTRIAFLSNADLTGGNPDGNTEIFLWTPGVGMRQITNSAGIATYECILAPMVSINADGTRIAFVSSLDLTPGSPGNADGSCELFLWTDAGGIRQLTNTDGIAGNILGVSISADGTTIALSLAAGLGSVTPPQNSSFDLFRWTEGSGISRLTTLTSGAAYIPSINADGTRIAFLSNADLTGGNPDGNTEIFLWTPGVGMRQITTTVGCCGMHLATSINANGTRIAFVTDHDLTGGNPDGNTEIFLWTQGASTPIMQITNTTGGANALFSISADGTRIAFGSNRDLTGGNPDGNWEIFRAKLSQGPPGSGARVVLVVPGIYGSWSTKLFCNDILQVWDYQWWLRQFSAYEPDIKGTKIPKKWTIDPILRSYDSLINTLKSNGFKPEPVPYDWRGSNTESVKTLMAAIDQAKRRYRVAKVDVVAHSMGGLLVRWYIQSLRYRGDINKFVILGTPNHGSVDAYYAWEGGNIKGTGGGPEKLGFEWLMERALENMKQGCGQGSLADYQFIRAFIPSVRELLPTFPFLVFPGIFDAPQPLACEENTFLQNLNLDINELTGKGVDVVIFSGTGQTTPEKLTIASVVIPCEPEWPDGVPAGYQPSSNFSDGDGRVLSSWIDLPGVSTRTKPAAHVKLSDVFRYEIIQFLNE